MRAFEFGDLLREELARVGTRPGAAGERSTPALENGRAVPECCNYGSDVPLSVGPSTFYPASATSELQPHQPPLLARVVAAAKAMLGGLYRWYGNETAIRHLQSMSDAQLKDIGLHRSQIHYLARKMPPSSSRHHHAGD